MKFTRQHTKPGLSPYEGANLLLHSVVNCSDDAPASSPCLTQTGQVPINSVSFPDTWSASARNICAAHGFVDGGIANSLTQIPEDDVPEWLWRHEPAGSAPKSEKETSLSQVIDRICGGVTYQGWKAGYFDSEEDASIFHDELRWLLFHQKISPKIEFWRHAGVNWAYGQQHKYSNTYVTDYRTGTVRRTVDSDFPPFGMVINATNGSLAGEGGIWDLWRRETDVLLHGGACGANVSGCHSSEGTKADGFLSDVLSVGDGMARAARQGMSTQSDKRRLTIDESHRDCGTVAKRPLDALAQMETGQVGSILVSRHIQAIIDACAPTDGRDKAKRRSNAALKLALRSARLSQLPEHLIERTLKLASAGQVNTADEILGRNGCASTGGECPVPSEAVHVIRIGGERVGEQPHRENRNDGLLETVAISAWSGCESGLLFKSNTDAWNTCQASGDVQTASGDGSYLFLDDTGSDVWVINAAAFVDDNGKLDTSGYQNAIELVTVAADISIMATGSVTPRLASRTWQFRPLSLSLTGLAKYLISAGIAYDSSAGRAMVAALSALMTSTAYRVSAMLAEELGQFPQYGENADAMHRVLDRHTDMAVACAHESSPRGLVETIEETWAEAIRTGAKSGFRNAQVTVLCNEALLTGLLDADTSGVDPLSGLTKFEKSPGGVYESRINPAVLQGLRSLGYDDPRLDDIVSHVIGHGTLKHAPGVNHETLRKRGFTETAISAVELALTHSNHISSAFEPAVLGEDYCRYMLGFTPEELSQNDFDMLAALGFSDAGIEAANIYCCGAGTLEGAPHLWPDHLAIFDCAAPQGERGTRAVATKEMVKMMGAVQSQISGGIGQTVTVPSHMHLEAYCKLFSLADRLALKSITLQAGTPAHAAGQPDIETTIPIDSEFPALSMVPDTRTIVADGEAATADDSKPSRHAVEHAARSAASVSSSADAVVEQRHV